MEILQYFYSNSNVTKDLTIEEVLENYENDKNFKNTKQQKKVNFLSLRGNAEAIHESFVILRALPEESKI